MIYKEIEGNGYLPASDYRIL